MAVPPITDPADLNSLTPNEIVASVRPLLAKAARLGRYTLLRRLEPNIAGAVFELALEWHNNPCLREGPAALRDYLAARLWTKLIAIDREQNPELYDGNKTYRPHRQFAPLEEHM